MAEKCVHQGCGKLYTDPEEVCVYHPGPPVFHEGQKGWKCCKPRFLTFEEFLAIPPCTEGKHSTTDLPPKVEQKEPQADSALVEKLAAASGSKGYSCCKRRVLEFDQFMKIEGCKTKERHLFVGSGKKNKDGNVETGGEEVLETVRTDFYQTPSTVIASFFLKKIRKDDAKISFAERTLTLDLPTSDAPTPKRYRAEVPLFAPIDTAKSSFKVLGTKLEVTFVKADGASWPVLRSDDRLTGEILQIGKAGVAQR
ncbi:hypothetical protein VdG1_01330 [Verticillium dahliae VDG1]|nr:hypothetical protein VdG1_01330 [Verticillium dahliae VDG1]